MDNKDILYKIERVDWRAELFWRLRDLHRRWIHAWYTFIEGSKARLIGVKLGRNVSFNGKTRIERFKHSVIEIGNGVTFNAHPLHNQLCRSCNILHTMTDYARIHIGNHTGFSSVCIKSEKEVFIGNNVTIGANTVIMDSDIHGDILHTHSASIHISDNVFIGMDSRILKGVTIGEGAIIGAGSIVNKDIPAHAIAAGVPCKVVRINK